LPKIIDPISIRLSWMIGPNEHYVGTFSLHLQALYDNGYIRYASPDEEKFRVKFCNDRGVIKLSKGLRSPGIVLGDIR